MSKYYYHPVTGEKVVLYEEKNCLFWFQRDNKIVPEWNYCCVLTDRICDSENDCPLKEVEKEGEKCKG